MTGPRIKLFRALDDEQFAAAFVDANGKLLPVFQLSTARTADACRKQAEDWLAAQIEKQNKPRQAPRAKAGEDIFG